ncbi:PucR family transcriptional regulator [Oceanirhabdus seepicola]|uniref:PucR family transcriptional regulator ligand-binding domain-containing protein n=1 Tax=Oceanirhabdus seepicola TaxID=2828781 RepID=A0A9J6P7B1_9CLOT|nr:PucR family transcriptional regulator [Oceanirhabdus seepicola]MCM1991849.1 PucR family transcriptional regulator ligand-binding domain-containing protein [Oceanirhabdus seepicola]
MAIRIRDILTDKLYREFRVEAGIVGIGNKISKVGILDHEAEDVITSSFTEGEFILTTLLLVKDHPEGLYDIVERLIDVKASGLAIKDIYFDSIKHNVKELADRKGFPIFIYSEVYMEDIILDIANKIKIDTINKRIESKIEEILLNEEEALLITQIANEINPYFKEKTIAMYCRLAEEEFGNGFKIFNCDKQHKVIPFREGTLIIYTFDSSENRTMDSMKIFLKELGYDERYIIGVSTINDQLGRLSYAIKESMYGYDYGRINNQQLVFFEQLGTDMLLLPLLDNVWVKKYYNTHISSIKKYDEENNTDLLETATVYVNNRGNMKATARDINQHDNTIRYRIQKIYQMISDNIGKDIGYEELALAIRIHKLIKGCM